MQQKTRRLISPRASKIIRREIVNLLTLQLGADFMLR
jgi:hypothetical protein